MDLKKRIIAVLFFILIFILLFSFCGKKRDKAKESAKGETSTSSISQTTTKRQPEIIQKDGLTYVDGILIVNKTYSVPSDFSPEIDPQAYEAFNEMATAAAADGVSLFIISGFRSYSRQSELYYNYVERDGKAAADTFSARPGHSEHQTGLAFDLNSLSSSFGETAEGIWLKNNCYKYGFIIRYPKDKENITGYIYEPWHVRYLGKDVAEKVFMSGLCLEEYLNITSEYN